MPSPLDQPEMPTPSQTPPPSTVPPTEKSSAPLAIQAPSDVPTPAEPETKVLDLGEGNIVKLDNLGPMIINSDGTLSRIQNWQDLHPIEQERTVRLLVKKRNLVRMQKLDSEQEESGETREDKVTALKEAS